MALAPEQTVAEDGETEMVGFAFTTIVAALLVAEQAPFVTTTRKYSVFPEDVTGL